MSSLSHKRDFQHILISRLRFMGDVILTTPLIKRLREVFPQARLVYLTESPFAPLLENNPHLDEVIAFSSRQSLGNQIRFYRNLRRRRFDLAIDLFGNPRSAILIWMTGAGVRIGGAHRGRGRLYTLRLPEPHGQLNAIDHHLRSLEALGIEATSKTTQVFLTVNENEWARQFLVERNISPDHVTAGLHPGATWPNKRWPTRYFAQVARDLHANNIQVVVTQGPGEAELANEVKCLAPQVVVIPVLPIRKVAAIQSHLRVFVSNDCGVMHLAVAVGTPTVGLFGPGQPEIWFPYRGNNGHLSLAHEIECRPCHKNFCPLGHLHCQEKLAPARVIESVLQIVTERRNASHAPFPG